jgi:hypothetical protein
VCSVVLVSGVALGALQPPPAAPPPPAESQQPPPPPPGGEGYTYNPAGRRDPFVSLVNRGSDPRATGTRPEGVAGLLVSEVALKGIVRTRGAYLAILQAPNSRTYVVRANDRLFDGMVKSITADGVTFLQEVNDPLSLVKQREVRKTLRPEEVG